LRHVLHLAKHLAGGGLIKSRLDPRFTYRFQQAHRAGGRDIGGVFRAVETHAHMALRRQIVHFIGLDFGHQAGQRARVTQISVMQKEPVASGVRVFVNRIQPPGVEGARAADDAM
jgi:hypothetical protein